MKLARTCYLTKQCSLFCSMSWLFIRLWVRIGHRNESACSCIWCKAAVASGAKQQIKIDVFHEKRSSAQTGMEQHSNFRWQCAKALKKSLVWFWIDHNQSLQPDWSQIKHNVWKQRWNLKWMNVNLMILIWLWKYCIAQNGELSFSHCQNFIYSYSLLKIKLLPLANLTLSIFGYGYCTAVFAKLSFTLLLY